MEIYTGNSLQEKLHNVPVKHRHCWHELMDYLRKPNDGRICGIGGLIETGKTTLMLQAIQEIGQVDNCMLIECDREDNLQEIRDIINLHPDCKYIFIDDFAKINGIGGCSVLADRYAYEGRKIVLTGDELMLFRLLEADILLDRMHLIDTNYVAFDEFAEISGAELKEYICKKTSLSVVDLRKQILKSYQVMGQESLICESDIADALDYAISAYFSDIEYDPKLKFGLWVCRRAGLVYDCNGTYVFSQSWIPYFYGQSLKISDEAVYNAILRHMVLLYLFLKYNNRDIKIEKYNEFVLKEDLIPLETIVYQIGGSETDISAEALEKIEKKTGTKIKDIVLVTMENAELLLRGEYID